MERVKFPESRRKQHMNYVGMQETLKWERRYFTSHGMKLLY